MASLIDNTWSGQGPLPNAGQENRANLEFKKWELEMYAGNRHLHNIPQKRKNEKFNNIRKKIYKKHGNIIIPERTISSTGRIVHRNQPSSSPSTLSPELVQKIANEKLKEYKRYALDSLTRGLGNQPQTNEIFEKLSHDDDEKRDKKMKTAMRKLESSFNTRPKSGSYAKRLKMLDSKTKSKTREKGPKTPTEGQSTRRINTSKTKEMAFTSINPLSLKNSNEFIGALKIARKVVKNLYTKGQKDNKFRTLNRTNRIVEEQLLPHPSVVRFLISLGFVNTGKTLVYNGDIDVTRLKLEVEGIDALLKKSLDGGRRTRKKRKKKTRRKTRRKKGTRRKRRKRKSKRKY